MHLKVPVSNWPADEPETSEYTDFVDNGSPTQAVFVIKDVSEIIQNALLNWLK